MSYRIAQILANKDVGAAGTESIDINLAKTLSKIQINWQFTNGVPLVNIGHLVDCLSKIELVDGSDVIMSMTGQQAQALNFFCGKKNLGNDFNVDASQMQKTVVDLDFGRFLWDEVLAFDPTKFANPQLKVTFDEDAANTDTEVNGLEVLGYIFDGAQPNPSGFLCAKETYSYTPAASAHEYISLPTDRVIRNMMFRCKVTDVEPSAQMDIFKLSEDNDNRIPFEISGFNLLRFNGLINGKVEEYMVNDKVVTAQSWFGTPAQDVQVSPVSTGTVTTTDVHPSIAVANTGITLGASTVAIRYETVVSGYAPHSCLNMPFGDSFDIANWYDPRELGSLRLDLLATDNDQTGGANSVVLQQVREY